MPSESLEAPAFTHGESSLLTPPLEREAHSSRICNKGMCGDTPEPRTRGAAPCTSPMFHAEAKVLVRYDVSDCVCFGREVVVSYSSFFTKYSYFLFIYIKILTLLIVLVYSDEKRCLYHAYYLRQTCYCR